MQEGAETRTALYSAFISYSHVDAAFARRLHGRLERYRLPRRLVRIAAARGAGARRLEPVFRDREELPAAADLTATVRAALERSRHIIVLCTPDAASSKWVGLEVALFREMHGDRGVLAVLWRGGPDDAFPPALTAPRADGRPLIPLAADFRRHRDGNRLGLLKLVAALNDVRLDELVQRDAQRRLRDVIAGAVGSVLVIAVGGILAFGMVTAQYRADAEHAYGARAVDLNDKTLRPSLQSVGRLDLLRRLDENTVAYFRDKRLGALSDADRAARAEALQQTAADDIKRGDFGAAEAAARAAWDDTNRLLNSARGDPKRIFAHAQSEFYLGEVRRNEGDEDGAAGHYRAYADLAARMVATDPHNPDWILERAYAASNLGMVSLRRLVDTKRAGAFFRAAQDDFEAVARLRPTDRELTFQVEDGHAWLADIHRLSGDYAGALRERLEQRRLIEKLQNGDPLDFRAKARMVSNDLALGRVADARGDWAAAKRWLLEARLAAIALVQQDPVNKEIASEARAIQLFQAQALIDEPPGYRPSTRSIEKLLANCAPDRSGSDQAERMTFCLILENRLVLKRKKSSILFMLPPNSGALTSDGSGDPITQRWHIDLKTKPS